MVEYGADNGFLIPLKAIEAEKMLQRILQIFLHYRHCATLLDSTSTFIVRFAERVYGI